MKIEIDPHSGFCPGVTNAIKMAEQILDSEKSLFCLGDIVHNSVEVNRLKKKGLAIIDYTQFSKLKNTKV